jgi:ABC-type branched-subunit amino acid transport system permease subunit
MLATASAYTVLGILIGLTYAVIALGIVLIYKGTRTINFAQPFMALFTTFFCYWGTQKTRWLPFEIGSRPRFAVAAILSLALIGLLGFLLDRDVMRRLERAPRLVTLVATIAVGLGYLGFTTLLFNRNESQATESRTLPKLLPDGMSFNVSILRVTNAHVLILFIVPFVAIAAALFFKYTRFGVAIRAAAENRESAQLLGISARRVASFSWTVGAMLAGLAGLLIAPIRGFDIASMSTGILVRAFAAALVGGLTSLPGALAGGVIVGVGESLIIWRTNGQPGVAELLFFVIVLAILIFRPGGIFGQREETEDKVAFIPSIRELPSRLRRNPVSRRTRATAIIVGLMLVAAASLATGPLTNSRLARVAIFATIGVSLTVLIGYAGQLSLGHIALVGVGAVTASRFYETGSVPFPLVFVIVFLMGMAVSLVIGLPALRIRGLYLAIVTITFNVAAETYIFKHHAIAGGSSGLELTLHKYGPLNLASHTNRPFFFFCTAMFLVCAWIAYNFKQSRTGRGFFALRDNEKAAATFGVQLTRYRILAFMLSGGIAALAGALYGFELGHVSSLTFATEKSLLLVAMVIIGGLGSLLGSAFGAFVVFGLPFLLSFLNAWIVSIGTGILLILVLTRIRGGVAGLVLAIRDPVIEGLAWEPGEQRGAVVPVSPAQTPPVQRVAG